MLKMNFIKKIVLLLNILVFSSCTKTQDDEKLRVLFLSGGGPEPNTSHNGNINHHKLKPSFLRNNMDIIFSSNLDDLNLNTLSNYDAIIMYLSAGNEKPERIRALIEYVEKGGGLVALHNTSGAFDGDKDFINLIGGQFDKHGSGRFIAKIITDKQNHPALGGINEFEVWDETYVHKNLNDDRIDLMTRDENGHQEPWTWIRTQGDGRVFYSAHGHDGRVWENFNFQKLVTSATIWVSNKEIKTNLNIPTLTYKSDNNNLLYNYEERQTPQLIQDKLNPQQSSNCLLLPDGFRAQLFAHEPEIVNPIDMTWDDRGRMYVAVTVDYPYIQEKGNDKIIICEDTSGDGKADKFTTYAEGFSLFTGMCWVNGGIILAQAPDMYFLQDTNGDDRADIIKKINSGWGTGDTHGGPSNLKYGFDNKIYGCLGGGGFTNENGRFSSGVWRMDVNGENVTLISNLSGNSWGLGISEDFELFASSANKVPAQHIHAPYPFFNAVGLKKEPALQIFDYSTFYPVTITRQGDHFGSYTAAAGFDLYTARAFPEKFWNKTAFVGAPTGKLLGSFQLKENEEGSYQAINEGSFIASFDERTAPIQGKTGPDGHLYMIDWNNLIMMHGGHLENHLRDKSHGRIYRITHKDSKNSQNLDLRNAGNDELINVLSHENMFWRMMAQKKLVQGKKYDAIPLLIDLAKSKNLDGIGSDPAVIHALWTLHGLGQLNGLNKEANSVAEKALNHPSAMVRKNAVQVLPKTNRSAKLLAKMLSEKNTNTLRHILLTLSVMPENNELGKVIYSLKENINGMKALQAPYNLALIRHGSSLAEKLIASGPLRNKNNEDEIKPIESQPKNILKNPSFEEIENGLPRDWVSKVHYGKASLSIDSSIVRTGKYSGKIESKVGGGAEFHLAPLLEPGEYLLSGWVKTKEVKGNNGVLLKAEGSGMKRKESPRLNGTNEDWQKLQMNFKVDYESGVLIYCLFGAWAEAKGSVWFDDLALLQLSSDKVVPKVTKVESLIAKEAFKKGANSVIRITKLINTRDEIYTNTFLEGLTELENINFNDDQIKSLRKIADAASPKNKMAFSIFASNNNIDLGLSKLATSIKGFEIDLLIGDPVKGKEYSKSCVVCHRHDFTGLISERSPSLPQLSNWYMQGQLQKYKRNIAGYNVEDSDGYAMSDLMKDYSNQQIADMVAYIKTFKPRKQPSTLGGDPYKGEIQYKLNCMACHQKDGRGNGQLYAPNLVGLSDVYIVNQLIKYRDEVRGSGNGDKHGKVMQLFAKNLKDEQAMKDIASYITTLQE